MIFTVGGSSFLRQLEEYQVGVLACLYNIAQASGGARFPLNRTIRELKTNLNRFSYFFVALDFFYRTQNILPFVAKLGRAQKISRREDAPSITVASQQTDVHARTQQPWFVLEQRSTLQATAGSLRSGREAHQHWPLCVCSHTESKMVFGNSHLHCRGQGPVVGTGRKFCFLAKRWEGEVKMCMGCSPLTRLIAIDSPATAGTSEQPAFPEVKREIS